MAKSPSTSLVKRSATPSPTVRRRAEAVVGGSVDGPTAYGLKSQDRRAGLDSSLRNVLYQVHPRYAEWADVWRELGHLYEGDGPYANGEALVPHPRELEYRRNADNTIDYTQVAGEKQKFKRRKTLARYENFAAGLTDTLIDHLTAKKPSRRISPLINGTPHPIEQWWGNVDGRGTHIDDWMKENGPMAALYGYLPVVVDRRLPVAPSVMSRADEGPITLRAYIPPDMPDWLHEDGRITAAKFVEGVERRDLGDSPYAYYTISNSEQYVAQDLPDIQFRVWTPTHWAVYDKDGNFLRGMEHGHGEAPIEILYWRKRRRIPVIGQSALKDPKVFKDHYNLVSELREILRNQTFSLLEVRLGDNETVQDARTKLGSHAGTDGIIFTTGGASYIAPSDSPAARYAEETEALERKMYRIANLPWEGDSRDAESADSRRLKAMDLNRTLASVGDNWEQFEYDIARRWFVAEFGPEVGQALFNESDLTIKYPDEFHTEDPMVVIDEVEGTTTRLKLGPTANAIKRKQALPILLPNLNEEERLKVEKDIDDEAQYEQETGRITDLAMNGLIPPAEAGDEGAGDGDEGKDDGTSE